MKKIARLEDLSNDLFLEIFDYLHALDIFLAFSSLNNRLSTILSLPQLHVVISGLHCRYHIDILSSHLFHHAHQVISVSLQDEVRDFSSVISFIFNLHTFENLQSCKFHSIHPSPKLHYVIEKLKCLIKLERVQIFQPRNICLSDRIMQDFSKTILMHRSPVLRSIDLLVHYHYPKLVANIALNSTLTTLLMNFHGSIITCSIYSLLPLLRNYRALRILRISISNDDHSDTQLAILPTLPATFANNPPISSSIKTFDLSIKTMCDFHSLNFILHCMPNLRRFILTIMYSSLWTDIFNGYKWQQLITNNTLHLDVFDIFLFTADVNLVPDQDSVVKSFDYFARKYEDWYMAIHRSSCTLDNQEKRISLRGFRRSKEARCDDSSQIQIAFNTLNIHSTITITDAQHHLIYSHFRNLHINVPVNIKVCKTFPTVQLFKNIAYLTIELDSSMLTFWESMLGLFNIRRNIPEIDQKECADKLASLVDLTNITHLKILPKNEITSLHFIKEILSTCSNVIQLKIGNPLIFSPILYDDSSLIPVFNRLQSLYLLTEYDCFPIRYASKLIKRFPSLIHLELEIYSVDLCIPLLHILLDGLPKLIHLKIHFHKNKFLGDGTYLINHVIKKRHQDEIYVKINEYIMDIYLSGCSICVDDYFK